MSQAPLSTLPRFAAIVLAADRTAKDPITLHTGAACKAFAPVAGTPMVIRVLDALAACEMIDTIVLCGPPESLHTHCSELQRRIAAKQVTWIPNLDSPSRSAESGLQQIPADVPVLLTTADHALLTPDIVRNFLGAAMAQDGDAVVATVRAQDIAVAFPGSKRTVIRLRDGGFCGCNLFMFKPQGRSLVGFWRQAEVLRKRPWRLIARVLGFGTVWSYLFGSLTVQQGLDAVSKKAGILIRIVVLDDPRVGVDVDKAEDLQLAESILGDPHHPAKSDTSFTR